MRRIFLMLEDKPIKIAIALLTVLLGTRFGGFFSLPPDNISAFWPVNALLFSLVFPMPERQRNVTLLLALPSYAVAELWIGYPPLNAAIYSLANVVEVATLLWLLRKTESRTLTFDKLNDLLIFISLALLASFVGGVIGTTAGGDFGSVVLRWSFADFFGYSLFVPLVLTWGQWRQVFQAGEVGKWMEFAALLTALFATLVFLSGTSLMGYPTLVGAQFLSMPILLWSAFRFGPWGGALATLIASSAAIMSAIHGVGIFAMGVPEENVTSLQLFFASLVVSVMSVACLNAERKKSFDGLKQEIAERKRAEFELEQYRHHLEELVEERASELKEANERLQDLDQLKSMFIASMSHELRTPLNSIIGFTGVLLQGLSGPLNEKQSEQLHRIKSAGTHLLSLISDVIDISKIEAGRVTPYPEYFFLDELFKEAFDEMEILAKQKGLEFEMESIPAIEMFTDRKRLYQCLLNYLSNAIKFTEKGKVILGAENGEDRIRIWVKDTGIGISEKDRPRLFEAFERLETHLRVLPGGTGLGLYLTRKITETLLQGSVWVETQEGEGSVFGLLIPQKISVEEEQP